MYGMVNKAVEEMARANFGDDAWMKIKTKAGIATDVFISNEPYSDSMTYQLVEAACEVLGLTADQVLHAFGEWWVLRTAREGYGSLMSAHGATLREFLLNLPNLHSRVAMFFPNLEPPEFGVSEVQERSLHLHYRTRRPGLTTFVVGLISGLGKMFATPVDVQVLCSRAQGHDHDIFDIRW
jgi:hypothetical protein